MIHKIIKIFLITLIFLFPGKTAVTRAEEDMTGEYLVKAAFLYNFAKFVEWPEKVFSSPDDPINLYILGEDPFDTAIETIRGKTIRGRELKIKVISNIEDMDKCHILFICRSEKDGLESLLDRVKKSGVLSVADMDDFAVRGGIINFFKSGNKIKFEINVDAAQHSGLKISSKLLKLARIVPGH